MSNNKLKIISLILLLFFTVLMGCYKTTTLLVDDAPAITATVSFSSDIVPLLTANCAKSGCHNGSISPDLSAANAYNSLVTGNFVSTSTPANSLVYLWLTGKESATMPLGASNNPSNINGYILAWITQGAENN
jgi:hypothetical protein